MTLAVDGAAVAAGAEGPERRGGAGEVQADVPERIYRRGDAAGRRAAVFTVTSRKTTSFAFFCLALVMMKERR